ncbi:MAG: anaerobic sulfatase maturase [Clostridia bacterium]|nr:anaerobic sulfatase maturase [Clostridia bacterium]
MPRPFTALVKPASSACNMRCRYCFYADEARSRAVANYGLMTLDTLESLVEKAFAYASGPVSFAFQGGEPTLAGLDFYRALAALEKKHNRRRLPVSNAIQTNGLLIDAEWAEFLRENRFLVGLSLDGYGALHDALRLDAAGGGTFARVCEAADLMTKKGVDFNILCVVSGPVARHAGKVYRYLRSRFQYLQFIPCLDPLDGAPGDWSLSAADFGRFLKETFALYYDDFMSGRPVSVRQFDNYVGMLLGRPPESCGMSGVCSSYFTVEGDGSVYPCDFYVLDEWKMGNVNTDSIEAMASSEAARRFVALSRSVNEKCAACRWLPLCRGGCRRNREPIAENTLNQFCPAYEAFFDYAYDGLCRIAAAVRGR